MKCISVSFKTAPEEIRNRFAFTDDEKEKFINNLNIFSKETKCIILTTCNRTEIYIEFGSRIFSVLENLLSEKTGLTVSEIRKYARYYENQSAIEHLFKVTCGLDSMIVGENEILAQIKQTYLEALDKKRTGYELNTIFLGALSCAKKIKTKTEISKTAISYATLACSEIKKFIQKKNISEPRILIIGGSGKIGYSIINNIVNKDFSAKLFATKRIHGNCLDCSGNIEIIDYLKRFEILKDIDIVVSATKSPHYTINYDDVVKNISFQKEMLFIDLASPYDIDREIGKLENCKLITIDYFENLVKNNNQKKEMAIQDAYDILEQDLDKVYKTIIYHDASEKIRIESDKYKDFSLEKFMFYLKDKLDANSFSKVVNVIKEEEGSLVR